MFSETLTRRYNMCKFLFLRKSFMDTTPLLMSLGMLFGSMIGLLIVVFGTYALIKKLSRKQPTKYWEDGYKNNKR